MNLAMMRIISRIMKSDEGYGREIPRIEPALRLAVAFLCVLFCALAKNALYVAIIITIELVRLSMKKAQAIAEILKPVMTAVLMTALFTLPAVFMGHPRTMLTVTMKVFESVLVLALMSEELGWKDTVNAFRRMHVPQMFVFTLDMTVKFLVILGRYSNSILEAVSLRSVGKSDWKTSGTGGVLGMTFLRSQQMAASTAEAMACRCFDGEYPQYGRRKISIYDIMYATLIPALILLYIYTEGRIR